MRRPSLAPFFDPQSIAVIGASRDPSKVGGSVLANLRSAGFLGRVVPINASSAIVQGLEAYVSLREVEGEVDLAVITVPAQGVLPALKDCVRKGVRGAVVISAGFRESTDEGRQREAELREWLGGQSIRLLGDRVLRDAGACQQLSSRLPAAAAAVRRRGSQRRLSLGDQLRVGAGLTRATDGLIIKMILGRRF